METEQVEQMKLSDVWQELIFTIYNLYIYKPSTWQVMTK